MALDAPRPSSLAADTVSLAAATVDSARRLGTGAVQLGLTVAAALRVRQWTKNILVAVPLLASGRVADAHTVAATGLAIVAFCLSASTAYLGNDLRDRELDAQHPIKKERPIASGRLSVGWARTLRTVACALALVVAAQTGWPTAAACAGYMAIMEAYSCRLKHVPIVELAIVSGGFVGRVLTGALAGGIPASRWLIIVVSAAALHLVTTKRAVELDRTLTGQRGRPVLSAYPANWLRDVRVVSLGVAVVAYCLWAFERASTVSNGPWPQLTIVPVVLAVLRYTLLAETGHETETPEEVLLHDRMVQVCAIGWAAAFAIAVVLAR